MKEWSAQINQANKTLRPFSQEDLDIFNEYKDNQVIRIKSTGVQKPRSMAQLRMFWACCRTVAENTNDQHWNHEDKVAFQIKVELQFVDTTKTIVDRHGQVHLHYRSIAFKNLAHMEACRFFERAWPVMAKKLSTKEHKVTVDELLVNADFGKSGVA